MLKRRVILGAVILLSSLLYYFAFRAGSARELDIVNFPWNKVSALEVFDRGILGNKKLKITDPDSIAYLSKMILKSTQISFNNINIKASLGLCMIDVIYNDGNKNHLELIKTSFSGGVLSSGDHYYRNDGFLNEITLQLKSSNR